MSEQSNHENQFSVQLSTQHDNGEITVLFQTHIDHSYPTLSTAHHVLAILRSGTETLPILDTQVLFAGPGVEEALEGFNSSHIQNAQRIHPLVTLDVTALALILIQKINDILGRVHVAQREVAGGVIQAYQQGNFISPMELGIACMATMYEPAVADQLKTAFLTQTAQDQLRIVADTQTFGSYTL